MRRTEADRPTTDDWKERESTCESLIWPPGAMWALVAVVVPGVA